jgi:hypothetical protein
LFGAIYLAVHGNDHTTQVLKRFGNIDTEEKDKIARFLLEESNKGISKLSSKTNHTCTKVLCTKMIQDLTSCKTMPFYCTIGASLYYQSNIVIVDTVKKIIIPFYYTSRNNNEENDVDNDTTKSTTTPLYILYKNPEHKLKSKMAVPEYFVDVAENTEKLHVLQEKYLEFVGYEKPLRGVSTYKVSELEKIAQKLGISTSEKKIKKNELYEQICLHCVRT